MEPELIFRYAQVEDAHLLSETAISSKKFWGYSDEMIGIWRTDLEVTAEYILANSVVKVFFNDDFIGFFALKIENAVIELDHLWLIHSRIKQHFGTAIFRFIKSYLLSNGFEKITLTAEPNAKGFYDKMGGKVIGTFESKISGRFLDIYEFQFSDLPGSN